MRALVERGVNVFALAPDFDEETHAAVESLGAKPVEYSLSRAGMNPLRDLADIARLRRVLRLLRPEASLAHFIKPVIYGSIAAWAAGVPKRYSMVEGLGYVFVDAEDDQRSIRKCALRASVSSLYRCALALNDRVFFLNDDDATYFEQSRLIRRSKIARIDGIGVDLEYFAPAEPVLDPITFLFVGRMLREKGIYEFVHAAKRLRRRYVNVRFILVGGTDCNPGSISETELLEWTKEGLVEWMGHVRDVREYIAQASVFVLPSYREGLPRSSQEAMSMARPVITTDAAGCKETVADGINGWKVPVRDAGALEKAMQRFIDKPALIAEMGRESRRAAERRFDVRAINQQIMGDLGVEILRA